MSNALLKLWVVLLGTTFLAACATWREPEAPAGAGEKVSVYSTTQLTPNQYQIIKHIWTDDWHSNIKVPTFRTPEDGVAALKQKAAAAGGTGLLNVMCMDARGYSDGRLLCYGDAIKTN